ncbi:MAG: MarR family transcriptional regulator [Caulobacteraceae bacterium]|nr:MarR family transcriptional regulator [Caulobacteraceae bacterium]
MLASPRQPGELLIDLIDEIIRGRTRLPGAAAFHDRVELQGLAGTVLTAVVLGEKPTVPQIGRSLGYPRQTIQRQADLLVELGLVEFVENPDHKRARRLVATAEGRAAQHAAGQRSRIWADQFCANISAENLAITVETLRAIRMQLESAARASSSPRAANILNRKE